MTNFDIAQESLQTSLASEGSAMREHEKWMESLQAKINQLKAAWQGFSQAFMSSDFLKGALDTLINILEVLTKMIDTVGVIPTLLAGVGLFKLGKKGLGSLFGVKQNEVDILLKMAEAMGIVGVNSGKSAGLMNKAGSALKGMITNAGGAGAALKGAGSSLFGIVKNLNPATLGIAAAVAAVGLFAGALIKAKKDAKELAEEVDKLTTNYQEQHGSLIQGKAAFETQATRYAQLSKGVDSLGRNVSLTSGEYEEYLNVTNSIADQVPSLVAGYDEHGNAILNCAGNVDTLTAAYENLIKAQNDEILVNMKDVEEDFNNVAKDYRQSNASNTRLTSGSVDVLEKMLNESFSIAEVGEYLSKFTDGTKDQIKNAIESSGMKVLDDNGKEIDLGKLYTNADLNEYVSQAIKQHPDAVRAIVDDFNSELETEAAGMKSVAEAVLSNAFDISDSKYADMNDTLQTIARQIVSGFDFDFYSELEANGQSVEEYIHGMLDEFNRLGEAEVADIEAAFDLQTKFNNGEVSYGQYVKGLQEAGNIIDALNVDEEIKSNIKLSLGLNEEGIVEEYEALVNRLTETSKDNIASGNVIGLSKEAAKEFLDGLSAEEYSVAMDVITDPDFIIDKDATDAEIRAAIQSAIDLEMALQGLTTINIETETAGIEALNTALEESRTAAGLTADSISALKGRYEDLEGYNAAALFEKTANGIHLNNEELRKLEAQYANTQKLNIDTSLNTLATKYSELSDEIANCTDEQKKESLQAEADIYADRIEELSTLASQYEGLTSAFNQWQTAQEGAEEGDNYDSLYDSLEGIKELYDGGLVGTDKFRAAVQLMSNEDLSTASVDKLVSAYKKGFPKIQRYFTEGSEGCQNFLKDVSKLNSEWAHMNEDGSWEIDFGVGNDQEIADALGINVDTVQQILRKLKDYGFEVEIDSDYTSLDGLQTKVEKTEARLKELNEEPVDINIDIEADAKNIKTIETEIENAKSKINEINNSSVDPKVKTAQLEDAKAKLESLIDKKIEASQPAFMKLNTSQVSASLVDALGKIQEYQTALNELNKLSELKEAGITIDDSQITLAQQKVDECAEAIQGLDSDVKVSIGLEQDGSIDSIKQAFEEGKVKIDTDTSPAVTKVEQLAKDVEKIEDKDVTINVKVKGLDDVKKLNKNIDLATKIDGDVDNLSEYVKSAKTLSKLGNNIVSYVTANVDGNITEVGKGELENLKTFAGSAKQLKQLKDVGSFTTNIDADVNANVSGNVTKKKEKEIDNLSVFAEEVKSLYGVEGVSVTASADIRGNVIKRKEKALDNLSMFAEEVRSLSGVEGVSLTASANVKGNVINEKEKALDNLSMFAEEVKSLEGVEGVSLTASADIKGNVVKKKNSELNNLSLFAEQLDALKDTEGKSVSAFAEIKGNVTDKKNSELNNISLFAEQVDSLKNVEGKSVIASADIKGNVTDKDKKDLNNIGVFAEEVAKLADVEGKSVTASADIKGNVVDKSKKELKNLSVFAEEVEALNSVKGKGISVTASAEVKGDVVKKGKKELENLGVFAEQVEKLNTVKGMGTSITVSAEVKGDVTDKSKKELKNLSLFAEQVEALNSVKGKGVSITASADIKGNVTDKSKKELQKLGVFSEQVESLNAVKGMGMSITASADIKGNVVNKSKKELQRIGTFAEEIPKLADVEGKSVTASAEIRGNVVDKSKKELQRLGVFSEQAAKLVDVEGVSVIASADIKGNVDDKSKKELQRIGVFAEQVGKLKGVEGKSVTASADIKGNVAGRNGSEKIANLKSFVKNAGKLSDVGSPESVATAKIEGNVTEDGNKKLKKFSDVAAVLKSVGSITIKVVADVAHKAIEGAIALLEKISSGGLFKNYNANVKVDTSVNSTAVDNYQPAKKTSTVTWNNNTVAVDKFKNTVHKAKGEVNWDDNTTKLKTNFKASGTVTWTSGNSVKVKVVQMANGTANAAGTAFADGSSGIAFKQGDWKTKKDVTALTGELGQELVVPPNGNRWYTVGDNGAEFAHIPRGSIVFNHKILWYCLVTSN